MFGNGKLAVRSTFTAGLAGLVMLTAAPALASTSSGATAVPTPAATGSYKTWSAAQRAAGFRLKRPHSTFGLSRTHGILVNKCQATGKTGKREVYAEWDGSQRRYMSVDQNNSGGACSDFGDARPLGTYRVQGHKAHMFGFCGMKGLPSCSKKSVVLVLDWKAGRDYYVTYSGNEWRRTLVAFARSLRKV
jgi:hypothetical protein